MKLSFAFSPCPNDTFMFEPIVNKRIDLEGLEFDIIMQDVEHLNKAALHHIPDITKLSFNAFTKLTDFYQLLNSGSALGVDCGPLLVSKKEIDTTFIGDLHIAIPGINTTAYLLLRYAFPKLGRITEMLFSEIEEAVLSGKCDAGLIIHENRFTYALKGLKKIIDLGEFWQQSTGCPIPLGGIVIKRSMDQDIKTKVNRVLYNSIMYARAHPDSGIDFIKSHAAEMDQKVMFAHINLYVNEYSESLGPVGQHAIHTLFRTVHPDITDVELKSLFV